MQGLIDGWKLDQRRRGLLPTSIAKRASMIAGFGRWHCGTLLDVEPEHIEVFLDSRRGKSGQPIEARTRYTYLSALGCFYQWAQRHGLTETNPAAAIARPKLRKTLPRPISDDNLAYALAHSHGQMHLWFLLAAYAGLRCAELAELRRTDVLYDVGMLRILGKGAKERLVPMHQLVDEALRAWPMPRTTSFVFTRPTNGVRWSAQCVSRSAAVHLDELGIDATLHQFRHWFGTRTLRACRDLRVVQELMGHASPTTTAIYTAFCNEDGRAAVHALEPAAATAAPARVA